MSGPSTVRSVPKRTIGSRTRITEEFPLPASVYYPGQWLRAAWRRKLEAAAAALFLFFFTASESFLVAAVMTLAVAGFALLTLFMVRQRRSVAGITFRQLLASLHRRRLLENRWPTACFAAHLTAPRSHVHPKLRKVREISDGAGFTATVASGRLGIPVPRIAKEASTVAEVIGCREVVVASLKPGVARLEFHWEDPVGRHLDLGGLPAAPRGHLAYGVRSDGSAATIQQDKSVLIGGLSGHGKSNMIHALLADAIRQQVSLRLYVSDPKGGIELKALGDRVGQSSGLLEVRRYATTPKDTLDMIEQVEGALRKRQAWLEEHGVRKHTPTPENPLVVVILDETLPLTDMLRKGTDSALGRIAYMGRAAGYVVWALAQVAQVDSIGRFRDLIPQRVCFATPTPQVTDSVLGQGSEANGAECSEIRHPGVGYSYAEGTRRPLRFRAAYVTDAETRIIAAGQMPYSMHVTEGGEATALYRHYDATGQLLYVGISNDYARRTDEHAASKPWWSEVAETRVEHFPSRKDALAAERRAIASEAPLYNVQHAGRVRALVGAVRGTP